MNAITEKWPQADKPNFMPIPMKEVCDQLGINAETVQKWADAGEVRIWQPGGKGGKKFVYFMAD